MPCMTALCAINCPRAPSCVPAMNTAYPRNPARWRLACCSLRRYVSNGRHWRDLNFKYFVLLCNLEESIRSGTSSSLPVPAGATAVIFAEGRNSAAVISEAFRSSIAWTDPPSLRGESSSTPYRDRGFSARRWDRRAVDCRRLHCDCPRHSMHRRLHAPSLFSSSDCRGLLGRAALAHTRPALSLLRRCARRTDHLVPSSAPVLSLCTAAQRHQQLVFGF